MPAFFIPFAKDAAEAESVYEKIRRSIGNQASGPLDIKRIYRIEYLHNTKRYLAEVGLPEQHEGNLVFAILKEHNYPLYLICTPDRGIDRRSPIYVGERGVISAIDFDAYPTGTAFLPGSTERTAP